jgi:UDP-N-acetylglucosamine--N-acetylmuramyl-(pentapeptide) pyrophosphoryl-undecaprenol N-acetylglucosamine transferase
LSDILEQLLVDYQVIHICGQLDWEVVKRRADGLTAGSRDRYRLFPYLYDEMGLALRAADLVVSRAGAATLGEYPAFGVPSILIPYPYAWRYQKVNADYLAAAGAAIRLDDQDMAAKLLPTIHRLMNGSTELVQMGAAARALDQPGAARRVADLLIALAARGSR